jgi:hypothetical protein
MRILHLIPDLGLGGAQRMLTYAAAAVDRDRYRLQVAHWGKASALQAELERLGVPVRRLEGGPSLLRLARSGVRCGYCAPMWCTRTSSTPT